ncbi:MAG: ATP-binding protein [Proteobacteria bacterium]|nr:ATP-binding protein [Pseudomonadota bacterium]MBU1743924.1 ATP-binding protein [Pseudomonadota bacterium]MBU1966423.1 ATP-binding protein [Pseudomonadota bacterium]
MKSRPFWLNRIENAWREAPICWLAGVRRVGKTTLAKSLGEERMVYVNCDLPVTRDRMSDPELFYRNCTRPVVVFDEVHQLPDPSTALKIGADLFPHLKIMATGSSTLAASRKFQDTLTGRKRLVRLPPVLWDELDAFDKTPLLKRLYHGGLPQTLLSETKEPGFYREWIDSFFARDIQRLFAFRNPDKFTLFFEYLMRQSGGQMETAKVASSLGISRPTVESHLRALEITHAVTLVRPFFGGGGKEIVRMPKVYGFDTGFVGFCRGWEPLRPDDYGILWEHLVLEYLQAHLPDRTIQYWRDTDGREIDFILVRKRDEVDAIECKWSPDHFNADALKKFRSFYGRGANYLVCPVPTPGYLKRISGMEIRVCNPEGLLG